MKNPMKTIRQWLATIVTALTTIALFGIIFVQIGLATPDESFFIELGCVAVLTIEMRIFWYDFGETKRFTTDPKIAEAKDAYYNLIPVAVKDPNELDDFVEELNDENKANYVKNKIGARTPRRLETESKLFLFFHPQYKKLTKEEIGQKRFEKLEYKYKRKADKIRPIRSSDLLSLSQTELLYDSKNYTSSHKRMYQIISSITSVGITVLIASIAFNQIAINWESAFRFATYLCSMTWAALMSTITGYKNSGNDFLDYLGRLSDMLKKYQHKKERGYYRDEYNRPQ